MNTKWFDELRAAIYTVAIVLDAVGGVLLVLARRIQPLPPRFTVTVVRGPGEG